MKKILLFLGVLFLSNFSNSCSVDTIYSDDFDDGAINYDFWVNYTAQKWSEAASVFHFLGDPTPSYGRYINTLAYSDLSTRIKTQIVDSNDKTGIYIWDGKWGINCSWSGGMACFPVPFGNTTMVCNNYAVQNFDSATYYEWDIQISGNQINMTWHTNFIQCNNTFQSSVEDIYFEIYSRDHALGYPMIDSFIHENQTIHHKLTWRVSNCNTGEDLLGVNISISNTLNSVEPIPKSCVTNSDGECVFLFDYFCNMSCEDIIFIDALVHDTNERFADVEYENIGIGRDENSPHLLTPCYYPNIESHWIDFHIEDYAHNNLLNASCSIIEDAPGYPEHTCYTNSDGNCSILMGNGHYVIRIIRIDSPLEMYNMYSEELILESDMNFHIPKTFYLEPIYSTDVILTLLINNATDLWNKTDFNGNISIEYISGNPSYIGFSWKVDIINGSGLIIGIPRGEYELSVYNLTDYVFLQYNPIPPPVVWYYNVVFDTFEDEVENRHYDISHYSGEIDFNGTVYGCDTWNCVYTNNYIPVDNVSMYLESDSHIYSTYSDVNGKYSFTDVDIGYYDLFVFPELDGAYNSKIKNNICVYYNMVDYNVYLSPSAEYPKDNISIYGYVKCKGEFLSGVDMNFIPSYGWGLDTVTDVNGFFNYTEEIPLPSTISVMTNWDRHGGCHYDYSWIHLDNDTKNYEFNISLDNFSYRWRIIGNFINQKGKHVFTDYILYQGDNMSGDIVAEGRGRELIVSNMVPSDYTLKVFGDEIQTNVFYFTVPDNDDLWEAKDGIWDIGTIDIYTFVDFYKVIIYVIDENTIKLDGVRVELKHSFDSYIGNTDMIDGKIIFESIPRNDYIIYLDKSGYIFDGFKIYIDDNYTNTFVMGIKTGFIDDMFTMDDINMFIGFLGIPLMLGLFIVFIYSGVKKGFKGG